jgi:holo-[acyl-carrier protein] synthase
MIIGTGIDIVQVKRMEHWLTDNNLLQRYFSSDELSYVRSSGKNAAKTLAARFAAKEAFGKALGTGLANIQLKEIMISKNENGKPELKLSGTAQKALERSGAGRVFVSLAHEMDNAVAMVILEEV